MIRVLGSPCRARPTPGYTNCRACACCCAEAGRCRQGCTTTETTRKRGDIFQSGVPINIDGRQTSVAPALDGWRFRRHDVGAGRGPSRRSWSGWLAEIVNCCVFAQQPEGPLTGTFDWPFTVNCELRVALGGDQ